MISCIALEGPGRWRTVGVAALFSVAALPAVPLLWRLVGSIGWISAAATGAFVNSLQNSLLLALAVAAVSLAVGLPLGVLAALNEFPGRRVLLPLTALPLLVPSFLWAIGWSSLATRLGPAITSTLSGFGGCVLVFSVGAIPLTLLTSYAATTTLSGSQLDAVRLAGADKSLLKYASRHAVIPTLLAASLGGILTLSDPGPGQILGLRTAASEVLTSFSALYDFDLAAQQCGLLTAAVLALALPLAYFAGPRIARDMLARQSITKRRLRNQKTAALTCGVLALFVFGGVILPLLGLTLPLGRETEFRRAVSELARTGGNTLVYAAGAGIASAVLGLLIAFFVGRSDRLRIACIGVSLTLFCLPPAFVAIGLVQIAADAPAWTDPLLRSRLTVCLALGLRFFPVAAVLTLRAWGSTSATWVLAGGIHGVSLGTYVRRVALPLMLPAAGVSTVLVALLATADIGTALLLHPPGAPSLPLAIFTVMANARESLVASLCLVYIVVAGGLLAVVCTLAGGRR